MATDSPGRMIYFTPSELEDLENWSFALADEATLELIRRRNNGTLPDRNDPRWCDNNA